MQSYAKKFLLLMIPLVTCSCASIEPARMVPAAAAVSPTKIGDRVRVMDVNGGREPTFGGPMLIDNVQFKKALVLALQQSGLFNAVGYEAGELDLYTTIRSQDQKVSRGLQYTAMMVVTYKFMDSTGDLVWSASYDSEFSSTAVAGATRTVQAREGSVRENLASLLNGIRQQWPRD